MTINTLSVEADLINDLKNEKKRDMAFSQLIDLYQERIYWHIRKIVVTHDNASDVLQNTFIRVYNGIQSFKGNSALLTWIFRIAYNESIRFLDKNKKNNESLNDFEDNYIENLKSDTYFNGDDIQLKLQKILSELTEKQRTVFQMKYFDDLSFKQIAEIQGVSENTLKSSYYSAVKIIEEKIIL